MNATDREQPSVIVRLNEASYLGGGGGGGRGLPCKNDREARRKF